MAGVVIENFKGGGKNGVGFVPSFNRLRAQSTRK